MAHNTNRKNLCRRCRYVHKRDQHHLEIIKQAQEKK